ncbi:cysteine-rich CWC family protein [Marinomonas sp. M1K-6]|uniref:Cysteine-rich CWC family protein n=1 Tax=Marinomonas profundi TaxID=2726122 RepID=A0A847R579_9GAMM|nr:cysteine-rich CWC family protein [Marinomonas profundi]NLQ16147.1 cysteine-rich CWC family protein [Marinomonas profundi]UDV03269.1 cysteine-rich CWC family protein [Marinomonas profundi]
MKCPFCLTDNGCALDDCAPDESQACWCFHVIVPDDMVALIPPEQKGSVCVCRQCIEFYRADKLGFLKVFGFD